MACCSSLNLPISLQFVDGSIVAGVHTGFEFGEGGGGGGTPKFGVDAEGMLYFEK